MSDEKKYPPSFQKLREAREKGQLAVSQELVKLAKFVVIAEIAFSVEKGFRGDMEQLIKLSELSIRQPHASYLSSLLPAVQPAIVLGLTIAVVSAVVSWVLTLMQTKFNVAPRAWETAAQKLNPINNIKQIFSAQKLIQLVLGPIKVGTVLWVVSAKIQSQVPVIVQVYRLTPEAVWGLTMHFLQQLERASLLVLFLFAVLDWVIQKWQNYKNLKMTHQEVKQDYKNSEGDPEVKGHRRNTAHEILHEPSKNLPKPNAVVVNPEHISVGLYYDAAARSLPRVVVKGADLSAHAIKTWANTHQVPVIRYKTLARRLYATTRVGSFVASSDLRGVALLYRTILDIPPEELESKSPFLFELNEELANALLGQASEWANQPNRSNPSANQSETTAPN